jgi:hypothetical protein
MMKQLQKYDSYLQDYFTTYTTQYCHHHRKYAYSSKPSKITTNIVAQLPLIKTKIAAKITEITCSREACVGSRV